MNPGALILVVLFLIWLGHDLKQAKADANKRIPDDSEDFWQN